MRVTKHEGAELHDGDEAGQVQNFSVGVATIEDTGEVEELGTLVDLGPEALLQSLLSCTEGSRFLDEVKVREDTNDFWKAVGLEDVQKLEGFLQQCRHEGCCTEVGLERTISKP